jgi:hypothetical protein
LKSTGHKHRSHLYPYSRPYLELLPTTLFTFTLTLTSASDVFFTLNLTVSLLKGEGEIGTYVQYLSKWLLIIRSSDQQLEEKMLREQVSVEQLSGVHQSCYH